MLFRGNGVLRLQTTADAPSSSDETQRRQQRCGAALELSCTLTVFDECHQHVVGRVVRLQQAALPRSLKPAALNRRDHSATDVK